MVRLHDIVAPLTDSDLVATNDRYDGMWHESSYGQAPSSWSDSGRDALIYLAIFVAVTAITVIVSLLDAWPGAH